MSSPWVAVEAGTDLRGRARAMSRAHATTIRGGDPPDLVREVVASSWRRSVASGVDPDARAPRVTDGATARKTLHRHRLARAMPAMRARLTEISRDGQYLVALGDARGLLLWADGDARMLDAAEGASFLPGHSCHEDDVGTNAIGTALALGHGLQIFSAEHFNRRLHGWTCAAVPIVDSASRETIGVLNLSAGAARGHPDAVAFVNALGRTFELELERAGARLDERLRTRFLSAHRSQDAILLNADGRVLHCDPGMWIGTTLERPEDGAVASPLPDGSVATWRPFGIGYVVQRVAGPKPDRADVLVHRDATGRVRVVLGARHLDLSRRHGDIVVALARHPSGLEVAEVAAEVYGEPVREVTVRAEVSRLRRILGAVVQTGPYRLDANVRLTDERLARARPPQHHATSLAG